MATEVNQNYFAWSQEESSVQDISQGTTKLFGHGSISFGRFDLESLEWEKWSVFTNDKRHEEFGKFNGLVAKKKAYFEEYFKRVRELKDLQQQNQQTELNLDYNGDGSDSSQTGEDEPAAYHGAPTGYGTLISDSREQEIPTTTFEHKVECNGDHGDGQLVNKISASTHSASFVGLHQQVRGNVSDNTDIALQNAYSSQDDPGMAQKTTLSPKGTMGKEHVVGQDSKSTPKTVKMASNNIPVCKIAPKGPCSSKLERMPKGEICNTIGTIGGSRIAGLRSLSAISERPSTGERRPVTRNASRKPAEVTIPCRPSTSERHSVTRESAQRHANNTIPHRPATPDRHRITKDSAPKQFNIASPARPSTADRRAITKEQAPKQPNIASPAHPSTADRRAITKEQAPKQSNIAAPRRPSTPDRRLTTKESTPKQSNVGSLHRPLTGERRPTTRDMITKPVGIATSCRPSTDLHRPITRDGARKHADVVTLRRPSTAERRPVTRDAAAKHAIGSPPCRPSTAERHPITTDVAPKHVPSCRPSTAERRPITRNVAPKHVPSCRPSTAERRPVTKGSALKHGNVASSRWPLTPDRYPSKNTETSTPVRPSTGERHPIINGSALKSDQKTPVMSRAVPNCSKGAMFAAVTPRKAVVPSPVKISEPENIRYAKEKVEAHVNENIEKPKPSLSNFPPRKMLTSNIRDSRVIDNFRKPKEMRVQAEAFASSNTTSLQPGGVKAKAPIPPPPPPPPRPRQPSDLQRKPNANILPASGRKPKASTPRWH